MINARTGGSIHHITVVILFIIISDLPNRKAYTKGKKPVQGASQKNIQLLYSPVSAWHTPAD